MPFPLYLYSICILYPKTGFCHTLLSRYIRYLDNSYVLLRGFELAPFSIFQLRTHVFRYLLALLLYVLRLEQMPTPDSVFPAGSVLFGDTMVSPILYKRITM